MTIETIITIGAGVRAADTPFVAGAGQSLTLRSQDPSSKLCLVNVFSQFTVPSDFIIRSPRMHDNVECISFPSTGVGILNCNIDGLVQPLYSQDNIAVIGGVGGGVATFDNVYISVYYENLAGISGDLRTWDSIRSLIKNIMTVDVTPLPSVTGDWGAGIAINNLIDLFKSNTNYAILGTGYGGASGVFGISGPCTGGVILGIPLIANESSLCPDYLVDLSIKTGLQTIPVMKAADKDGTFCFLGDATSSGGPSTLVLAELGEY